jgi:peptidoglycan-associated lipoprotein
MRFLRVLALSSLSLLAVGCPPKIEPPPDPPAVPPPPPAVKLQVISIDPARVDAMKPFRAELFGSGFETSGMKVRVGVMMIASVDVLDSNTIEINVPPMPDGVYDVTVDAADGRSHTLRSGLVVRAAPPPPDPTAGLGCEDITINFDYDSARLSDGAMRTLEAKLACFTDRTGTVRIEGHCDERGTTNYNLALGQRRADAVSRWLSAQGVPSSRINAISFGEERPVDSRATESAYAKNRRGEISASN